MIRPSLHLKLKALARELASSSEEIQEASEPMVDAWIYLLRQKRSIESFKIDVVGTLGKLFSAKKL